MDAPKVDPNAKDAPKPEDKGARGFGRGEKKGRGDKRAPRDRKKD